ncbi:uncharacterized protein DUF2490 [Algoriphagus boseongensis]|uniref:Uncharacterized protein DUF2490 n=1 Tax=Algoriphagus boseongensis TaxID=1442587 RepID=A0A4R6T4S6_9BACT|nr:uncharacterized protein DUF2490 [Algoriphagus boseongensis]
MDTISQQWIQSYHEGKISTKWTALLDGGFRWREGFSISTAYIIRGGIGYSITPSLRIAAGFANLGLYGEGKVIRYEYRPYQEIQLKTPLGKIGLSQRFRIEERFYEDRSPISNFELPDFNYRFRYSVMFAIPLFQLSKNEPNRRLVLNLGNEIFWNAGKQATRVFDQNRLILSPTLQWNKQLSISFTYNRQFASTLKEDFYLLSNIAWLQIRHNLDFSKNQ